MSEENTNTEKSYEQDARAQGWKPQEEYQGDNWVDAKTFVERGEKYVGIMKQRMDTLETQFRTVKQTNEDLKRQYQRLEVAKQKEQEAYIKQLEAARKQAITNGDGEAFDRAEKQIETAKAVVAQTQVAQNSQPPAWAADWLSQNPWYGKDLASTAVAERVAAEIRASDPTLPEKEFLDKVAERVKVELPERFTNKKKNAPADAETETSGAKTSPTSGASGYKSLPSDAKSEFNRLQKEGLFKNTDEDRQRFADYYNGEE